MRYLRTTGLDDFSYTIYVNGSTQDPITGQGQINMDISDYNSYDIRFISTYKLAGSIESSDIKISYDAYSHLRAVIPANYQDNVEITITDGRVIVEPYQTNTLSYNRSTQSATWGGTTVEQQMVVILDNPQPSGYCSSAENAGIYYAHFSITSVGEYGFTLPSDYTGSQWTIGKASLNVTPPSVRSGLSYNGSSQLLLSDIGSATGIGEDSFGVEVSSDGYHWTIDPLDITGTNCGGYYISYRTNNNSNYQTIDSAVIANISQASNEVTTDPVGWNIPLTSTIETQGTDLTDSGKAKFGDLQYSLDQANWSSSVPTANSIDVYTIYYYAPADDSIYQNYSSSSIQSTTASIYQKYVPLPYWTSSSASSLDYNGQSQSVSNLYVYDSNYSTVSGTSSATNKGNYTLTFHLKDAEYLWDNPPDYDDIPKNLDWYINKATNSINGQCSGYNITYDGQSHLLIDTSSCSATFGSLEFSVDEEQGTYSTTVPSDTGSSGTTVTYTIYYRAQGDSSGHENYDPSLVFSVTTTISGTPIVTDKYAWIYTGVRWEKAIPYIYCTKNGQTSWYKAEAWIYDGSTWRPTATG